MMMMSEVEALSTVAFPCEHDTATSTGRVGLTRVYECDTCGAMWRHEIVVTQAIEERVFPVRRTVHVIYEDGIVVAVNPLMDSE